MDKKAALQFLKKAIGQHGRPVKITIDQSGANSAALIALNTDTGADPQIEIRQRKYLNNVIEQDHRAIKRITWPMLGFQTFRSARTTLQGIELMHRIKKGQMYGPKVCRLLNHSIPSPLNCACYHTLLSQQMLVRN